MKTATMKSVKTWTSPAPEKCDVCESRINNVFVDGRTQFGAWGCLCPTCHCLYGVGLGTGSGQQYERDAKGEFIKTRG